MYEEQMLQLDWKVWSNLQSVLSLFKKMYLSLKFTVSYLCIYMYNAYVYLTNRHILFKTETDLETSIKHIKYIL